ncbi:hypothetical protein DD237_005956 [Peronospora effusa]|uniref:Uncharacterized protein n=1 Tax=Peronospora effusa TaxID=542832 RepID=A0A425CHA0_9STRA|nr:hypothetical protein DD237_005956 [Peronospora effusa]
MGKSTMELDITAEKEFASLAQVLTITADDAVKCLKTLKNNLSEYDSQHGNHLLHTARLHMRSDIRHAKDVSADLKSVARQIHESHKPSKEGVASARTAMNAVTLAMDVLIVTAQRYDEKHSHSSDVKGAMKSAVNGKDEMEKDVQRDVFGNSNYQAGHQGGCVLSNLVTVEMVVKRTLSDNFNLNVLSHQITAAEKSLSSYSIVERAKEAVNDVKEKLTGNSSPTYAGHGMNHNLVTVEMVVKRTLSDNFNLNVLSHQITAAEKSLSSYSIVERAKEAVNDVKEKLTGNSSPTYAGHGMNQSVIS